MIKYKSGYKYQLVDTYILKLPFEVPIYAHEYFSLTWDGHLVIKAGYAWDGPSGPAVDTKNFMRGSLVHDALYQMIGLKVLELDKYRVLADKLLCQLCEEDGMSKIRSKWVYLAVRVFGGEPARAQTPIQEAP